MTVLKTGVRFEKGFFLLLRSRMLVAFAVPAEFLTMLTPDKNLRATDLRVGIGHVHLKISDLETSLALFRSVISFELTHQWATEPAFVLVRDAL